KAKGRSQEFRKKRRARFKDSPGSRRRTPGFGSLSRAPQRRKRARPFRDSSYGLSSLSSDFQKARPQSRGAFHAVVRGVPRSHVRFGAYEFSRTSKSDGPSE